MSDNKQVTVKLTANAVIGHSHRNAGEVLEVDGETAKALVGRKLAINWSLEAQADVAMAEAKRLEEAAAEAKKAADKLVAEARKAADDARKRADELKAGLEPEGKGEKADDKGGKQPKK